TAAVAVAWCTPVRHSAIGLDLDQTARDARVAQLGEHGRVEVDRQLDDGEVRLDGDRAEVVAAETALVRQRADDLTRLHPVPPADLDAVRGVVPAAAALTRTAVALTTPLGALARRAVVALHSPRQLVALGIEQQRRVALQIGRASCRKRVESAGGDGHVSRQKWQD